MNVNVNYHLTLSMGDQKLDVDLISSTKKNQVPGITIDGRIYTISGDEKACFCLMEKLKQIQTTTFKDISQLKAAIVQEDKSTEKVNDISVKILVKNPTAKEKLRRAIKNAAQIAKGLTKLREEGIRGRIVRPCTYIEVIGSKGDSVPLVRHKEQFWRDDKDNDLSFPEWDNKKTTEWKLSGTKQEFVEWVLKEKWKDAKTEDSFDDWELKEFQKRINNTDSFEKFKEFDTNMKRDVWMKMAPNLSFEKFDQLLTAWDRSGSTLSFENWQKHQVWKEEGAIGDFSEWVLRLDYKKEVGSESNISFEEWKDKHEEKTISRWEGSGFKKEGVSFEDWRKLQDDSLLVDVRPFVGLNDKQRELFKTSIEDGVILRNGIPFNTAYEKTDHSGVGYAVFVVSPELDIFSGSHVNNIFHHSSFLADGSVAAAGEIATDEKGKVTYLSSKSGHYRPTDEENRLMLQMFRTLGVDLSKVKFSSYVRDGKTLLLENAETYLNHIEKVQKEREKLRTEVVLGKFTKGNEQFGNTENCLVLNEIGQLYCGAGLFDGFQLEEEKKPSDFDPKTQIPDEINILNEIKNLKSKISSLTENSLEQNKTLIEEYGKKVIDLLDTLNDIRGLGKDGVAGGGTITFNSEGEICRIDTKIGEKRFGDEEIRFTLKHLQAKGVKLNDVILVTYTKEGSPIERKIDGEYYKEIMAPSGTKD